MENEYTRPEPSVPRETGSSPKPLEGAVVGIGVSAGGLEAIKRFFSAMTPDSGLSFVLIPHLDPTHESLMAELIAHHTAMPVVEATEGMKIERNHV